MNQRTFKGLITDYDYAELGFPVVIKDVSIVEERGYKYPLINHSAVILQVAFSLVMENQKINGARLRFIRRFMGKGLEQFSELIGGISSAELDQLENQTEDVCELSSEQIRSIYLELRNEILKQIGNKLDNALGRDFSDYKEIAPLKLASLGVVF